MGQCARPCGRRSRAAAGRSAVEKRGVRVRGFRYSIRAARVYGVARGGGCTSRRRSRAPRSPALPDLKPIRHRIAPAAHAHSAHERAVVPIKRPRVQCTSVRHAGCDVVEDNLHGVRLVPSQHARREERVNGVDASQSDVAKVTAALGGAWNIEERVRQPACAAEVFLRLVLLLRADPDSGSGGQ